jgi:hypothetical protein
MPMTSIWNKFIRQVLFQILFNFGGKWRMFGLILFSIMISLILQLLVTSD